MVQLLFMKTFEFVIFKFTPKNVRFCKSDKSKYKVECVFPMIIWPEFRMEHNKSGSELGKVPSWIKDEKIFFSITEVFCALLGTSWIKLGAFPSSDPD